MPCCKLAVEANKFVAKLRSYEKLTPDNKREAIDLWKRILEMCKNNIPSK